jgi:hypothetical protein
MDYKEANKPQEADKEKYPENGDNFSDGSEEQGSRPNNPAENAEKTSPEQDKKKKDDAME